MGTKFKPIKKQKLKIKINIAVSRKTPNKVVSVNLEQIRYMLLLHQNRTINLRNKLTLTKPHKNIISRVALVHKNAKPMQQFNIWIPTTLYHQVIRMEKNIKTNTHWSKHSHIHTNQSMRHSKTSHPKIFVRGLLLWYHNVTPRILIQDITPNSFSFFEKHHFFLIHQ
jgi:hypothetical protein